VWPHNDSIVVYQWSLPAIAAWTGNDRWSCPRSSMTRWTLTLTPYKTHTRRLRVRKYVAFKAVSTPCLPLIIHSQLRAVVTQNGIDPNLWSTGWSPQRLVSSRHRGHVSSASIRGQPTVDESTRRGRSVGCHTGVSTYYHNV